MDQGALSVLRTSIGEDSMAVHCPKCQSDRVGKKNYGKKAAGLIGASAGTVGGYAAASAGASAGAQTGMALGLFAGPVGATVGGIGGAIIGALVGGATGASAGIVLGTVLDETVLDNHICLACDHSFASESESFD